MQEDGGARLRRCQRRARRAPGRVPPAAHPACEFTLLNISAILKAHSGGGMRALLARVLLLCAGFAVSNTDSHVWALSCGRASAFAPPCGPAASAPRSAPRCQRNPTRSPPAIPPRARAKRRAENSGVGPRPHAGCSPLCCAPGPAAAATDAASAAPGSAAPEAQTWRVPDGVDWVEIWSEVVACAETDAGMKEVASARPLVRVEEVEQVRPAPRRLERAAPPPDAAPERKPLPPSPPRSGWTKSTRR